MRSSATAAAGRPRTRSVEFATIDEEPELAPSSSHASGSRRTSSGGLESKESEMSITLEDLDPLRQGSTLTADERPPMPTVQHRQSTASSAAWRNSRQQSSSVVSALRRFTLSRFGPDPSADQGGGGGPPSALPLPPGGNGGENHTERRTTIFNRQRRSTGTRNSSMTSSGVEGSRHGGDGGGPGDDDAGEARYCLTDAKVHALRHVIDSRCWRGITLFFILVLLFGPPIQDIWLPKSFDYFMDGILSLGILVLAFDIATRSIVDNSYFSWHRKGSHWSTRPRRRGGCNLHAGSFMFWLDTVALLTILYRLSYINPTMREPRTVTVRLCELGFPVAGRHATPLTIEWPLMLTVCRVGLMARFIRTSVLVQISSSWYWLVYFYPRYWTSKCKRQEKGKKSPSASEKVLISSSKGRGLDRTSDPFSVSSLDDTGLPKMASEMEGIPEYPDELSPQAEEKPDPMKAKGFFKGLAKKRSDSGAESLDESPPKAQRERGFGNDAKDSRSHVGAAMRELTGQRIATGALLALLMTVMCDWHESDTTKVMTMLTLHAQTANEKFANQSVNVARSSVIPTLYNYTRVNGNTTIFSETYALSDGNWTDLRDRERLNVNVSQEGSDVSTLGLFDNSQLIADTGKVELVATILLLFVWVLGVASFAGPVMTLVVKPIERMVRLLSLLMKDPLGYQSTPQYHKLKHEGDDIADKYEAIWPKEVLKGMETNFLMSTILRIGSLMRVGFGSAGVEIIRNNIERGRHKDVLFLSKQGGSVSCIFLFCDIRSFTDATECLQEEVFVFTNKVAAVVHSICHSYGGSANKNIGDAFLVSWLLDEPPEKEEDDERYSQSSTGNLNLGNSGLYAKNNQADKALLSVVKILMALHYDNYYVDDMNEAAKDRLLAKLSKRKGPIVQMGFGLHAGNAVQGAIGSQRKLDATYISESVERSEFLESSTKKYGVPLLMSDAFYNLLDSATRNRCRKVDQLVMLTEEEDGDPGDPNELLDSGEKMDIYTFDMDIDALWRDENADDDNSTNSDLFQDIISQQQRNTYGNTSSSGTSLKRRSMGRRASFASMGRENPFGGTSRNVSSHRRGSLFKSEKDVFTKSTKSDVEKAIQAVTEERVDNQPLLSKTLVLPTGVRTYNERAWREPDIKKIRRDYVSNGIIFPKYQEGLKSYCTRDWGHAKQCFEFVLSQREDGPSRCFLDRMKKYEGDEGVPPRNFIGYTPSDWL